MQLLKSVSGPALKKWGGKCGKSGCDAAAFATLAAPSGDVPRRKLNRENDVRGTCVFLSLKILFPKSVAHGRPGCTYGLYATGAEAIGS